MKQETELQEVLEIKDQSPMLLEELELNFSNEFPSSNKKKTSYRDVSSQTSGEYYDLNSAGSRNNLE